MSLSLEHLCPLVHITLKYKSQEKTTVLLAQTLGDHGLNVVP